MGEMINDKMVAVTGMRQGIGSAKAVRRVELAAVIVVGDCLSGEVLTGLVSGPREELIQ